MKQPLAIRARLTTAALSLSVVYAAAALHDFGLRSAGETAFTITRVVIGVGLAFFGVFSYPQLQVVWGWGLAVIGPLFVGLCIFAFHGTDLVWGLSAAPAAFIGGYLLLLDAKVKAYRESIKRKNVA